MQLPRDLDSANIVALHYLTQVVGNIVPGESFNRQERTHAAEIIANLAVKTAAI